MTKTLLAKVASPIQATALNSDLDIVTQGFYQELIDVNEIALGVNKEYIMGLEGFPELERSILEDGMENPIIICQNTEEAWGHSSVGIIDPAAFEPKKLYLCLYGNQRLVIAKRFEFTHIGALIANTPFWAITLHHALI